MGFSIKSLHFWVLFISIIWCDLMLSCTLYRLRLSKQNNFGSTKTRELEVKTSCCFFFWIDIRYFSILFCLFSFCYKNDVRRLTTKTRQLWKLAIQSQLYVGRQHKTNKCQIPFVVILKYDISRHSIFQVRITEENETTKKDWAFNGQLWRRSDWKPYSLLACD